MELGISRRTANASRVTVDSYMCPTCGAEVKVGATCPGCVPKRKRRREKPARAQTEKHSWEQDDVYDGLDLPEGDFDYDDFVAREFGDKPHGKVGIKWYWWATAIVLAIAVLTLALSGLW